MYPRTYFSSGSGSGGGSVDLAQVDNRINTVVNNTYVEALDPPPAAKQLRDDRIPGNLPPAKYARLAGTAENFQDTVHNTNRLAGVDSSQWVRKYTGLAETFATVQNAVELNGVPASSYALKTDIPPATDTSTKASKWDATTNIQDTVYNAVRLNNIPASSYALVAQLPGPLSWDIDDAKTTLPFQSVSVFYATSRTGDVLNIGRFTPPSLGTGSTGYILQDMSAFTGVNQTSAEVHFLNGRTGSTNSTRIFSGNDGTNTIVAGVKYNSGTSIIPNNRDYVTVPPGGMITCKLYIPTSTWYIVGSVV